MTDTQVYIATDSYQSVLDDLEYIARDFDPAAPDDLRTRLIMILGEVGGVWPVSCFTGQDEGEVIVAASVKSMSYENSAEMSKNPAALQRKM